MQIFPLREGKMIDRYAFHLENVGGQDLTTVLEEFCLEYYGSSPSIPPQIVVPRDAGDLSALEQFLSERRGARVEVRAAERGEKRRLQELATENARLALASEAQQTEQRRLRRIEALEELREALNLESLPIRIECFDISNIQGESVVGSMVVFQDAVAKKAHYRKFGVQSLDGQDDFAAMAEVVSRRFARLANADSEQHDESFAAMPNLVVIDGGKGQLSAALAAMQAFDLPRVAVIALAKKDEEVYVPGQPDAVRLPSISRGCSCSSGSATRRTASPSGFTGNGARRARSSRSSTRCAESAQLAARRSCSTSGHPKRSWRRRRKSSRACRSYRRRPPALSTRSCTRPAAGRDPALRVGRDEDRDREERGGDGEKPHVSDPRTRLYARGSGRVRTPLGEARQRPRSGRL